MKRISVPFWILLLTVVSTFDALAIQDPQKPEPKRNEEQDTPVQLKANLIEVRAVVTDKSGRVIDNLKQEDFELLEDDQPQPISFFSLDRVEKEAGRPQPAGVVPTGVPQRTIVLVVDTLNLAAADMALIKQGLKKFIDEQMTDQDMVAIVTTSGMLGVLEQFTRDRNLLRSAVERLRPLRISRNDVFSPYLATLVLRESVIELGGDATRFAIDLLRSSQGPADLDAESRPAASSSPGPAAPPTPGRGNKVNAAEVSRAQVTARMVHNQAVMQRKRTLNLVGAVIDRLTDMPGQRLLTFLSPGFTLQDNLDGFDDIELRNVTSRAVRSGVLIYSIDGGGLQTSSEMDINNKLVSPYAYSADKDAQQVLNAISRNTGGEFYSGTNDLGSAVKKVLDENRTFYTLAYYPALEQGNFKYRSISVKVKNHPEYEVRTQKGYSPAALQQKAAKEMARTAEQRVLLAMASPLLRTDIGVATTATILKAEAQGGTVVLQTYIDANALAYRQEAGTHAFDIEVFTSIYGSDGKQVKGFREKIQSSLTKERLEQAKRAGITNVQNIPLKPGMYNIRVGVHEASTDKVGTAIAWMEIPDVKKNKLAMGGIVLSEGQPEAAAGQPAVAVKNDLILPNVVNGMKLYKKGGLLLFGAVIFAGPEAKVDVPGLQMQMEILSGDKSLLKTPMQSVSLMQTGKDESSIQVGGQIKVEMPPGMYELRIVVEDPKTKQSVIQSALFRVET